MKNNSPSHTIKLLAKDALHDLFIENRKHHEAGIIHTNDFEEVELAICEVLHNIFVAELYDAVANKRLMTGEKWIPITYRVCGRDSDHEATFAGDDKFSYDLWVDIIGSLNKMRHSQFYITNEMY